MTRLSSASTFVRAEGLSRSCPTTVVVALLVVGCSSGPSDPVSTSNAARAKPAPESLARSVPAVGRRPTRPIPDVIAKAKPFRIGQADVSNREARPADGRVASGVQTVGAVIPMATSSRPSTGPDVAGINRMMRSYLQAFNRHDPAALAAHWSAAGENVDLDTGAAVVGREAVHEVFTALFEQDADATIDIDVTSIRGLRDDVAVVDGVSRIAFTDGPPSSSRFSAVLVRQDGEWMLDSVRESTASAGEPGVEPVGHAATRPLDALAWLVGSWEDVSEGVTASTQCAWSTNRAFLVRTHLISSDAMQERRPAPGDGRIPGLLSTGTAGRREITEIIGEDPDRGELRSWLFTSDGRFAEGTWSREGDDWTLRLQSGPDDCLVRITRDGPDSMHCRCDCDRLADVVPPTCDFARTARSGTTSDADERSRMMAPVR